MHGKTAIDLQKPENQTSGLIIDTAFRIHKALGPGLLENAYEDAMCYFLEKENLRVDRQKTLPLKIENHIIAAGFRPDMIVENQIICEIKSVEKILPIHQAQLMTYLRLSGIKIGLLINFGNILLKDGIKRIVI